MGKFGPIVPFETLSELFKRLTDHYHGQGRTALRYKDKKTKQWVDITWEAFREYAEQLAAYLYEKGVRK